jgi:hypothetical protein
LPERAGIVVHWLLLQPERINAYAQAVNLMSISAAASWSAPRA